MSPVRQSQVGVCIVKVERQPDRLLITVTTNRNLDRNLYSARSETPQHFVETAEALRAAAEFLMSFDEEKGTTSPEGFSRDS